MVSLPISFHLFSSLPHLYVVILVLLTMHVCLLSVCLLSVCLLVYRLLICVLDMFCIASFMLVREGEGTADWSCTPLP
jgi:hypothetical protein